MTRRRTPARRATVCRFCQAFAPLWFPGRAEQTIAFMRGVTLLGPRSMEDIRQAALATLAPPPDRRREFEALFRSFFYGEATVTVDGESDEDTAGQGRRRRRAGGRAAGAQAGGERRSCFCRRAARRPLASSAERQALADFRRALPEALPQRRSFRSVRTSSRGKLDLRRSLRSIVRSDGDVPAPPLRRRPTVSRRLLILIDISGSMKLHTGDYLEARACRRAGRRSRRGVHARHAADPHHRARCAFATSTRRWRERAAAGRRLGRRHAHRPDAARLPRRTALRRLRAGRGDRAPVGRAGARRPCRDGDRHAPARRARLPPVAADAARRRSALLAADGRAAGDPALPRRPGRRLVARQASPISC